MSLCQRGTSKPAKAEGIPFALILTSTVFSAYLLWLFLNVFFFSILIKIV